MEETVMLNGLKCWVLLVLSVVIVAAQLGCSNETGVDDSKGSLNQRLFIEAKDGNALTLAALVRAGAEVNARDPSGATPLMWAAYGNRNANAVRVLLDSGADADIRDNDGWTPLMVAATANSNANVIRFLFDAGANPNARDKNGMTPLMLAAWFNQNPDVANVLIENGSDVNARHGGSSVNANHLRGSSALLFAARSNPNEAVIESLIESGADINITISNLDWTPLMVACRFNKSGEVVRRIIQSGLEVNQRDALGTTPLMLALGWNPSLSPVTQIGMKNSTDFDTRKLLRAPAGNVSFSVIQVLIEAGADVNFQGESR